MRYEQAIHEPPNEEEGKRRAEKANSLIGAPFQHLPGNLPEDSVLYYIDGYGIQVSDIEMVWNDQWFIDKVCGNGNYRQSLETEGNLFQIKILDLAEKLHKNEP